MPIETFQNRLIGKSNILSVDFDAGESPNVRFLGDEFHKCIEIITGRNWKEVFSHFFSMVVKTGIKVSEETHMKSYLAQLLEKAYYLNFYAGNTALDFMADLEGIFVAFEPLPDFLTENCGREILGKQQPSFLASVSATVERFSVIERLPEIFGRGVDAMIIGGSMSYGPFFNVRGLGSPEENSDVDLIFIVNDSFFSEDEPWALLKTDLFQEKEKASFFTRKQTFLKLHKEDNCHIFSHLFSIIEYGFNVSMHFLLPDTLEHMIGSKFGDDLANEETKTVTLRDYRSSRFRRSECPQQNFDGSIYDYHVPEQIELTDGFITEIPSYIISDGKLFLGFYQDLLSPEPKIFFDRTGATTEQIKKFKALLILRFEKERERNPTSSLVQAYMRNDLFAPGRY